MNKKLNIFLNSLSEEDRKEFLKEYNGFSKQEQSEILDKLSDRIPKFQKGGMKPVSPFMNLKMYKNKYKLPYFKEGGILEDYISGLPQDQQSDFVNEFAGLEPDVQEQVIQFMMGGKYQFGGTLSEVEGDETAVLPDSELVKFEGKKHKDGGIKVDLPGGTRIFSEHLKAPNDIAEQVLGKKVKGKMSYADISKKFPTKPYLDTLKHSEDEYARTTAELKLTNNLAKLDTLFYAQEQSKKQKSENKFQDGGYYASPSLSYFPKKGQTFQSTPQTDVFYDPYKNQYVKRISNGIGKGRYHPIEYNMNWYDMPSQSLMLPEATVTGKAPTNDLDQLTLLWNATDKNRPYDFSKQSQDGVGTNYTDEEPSFGGYMPIKDSFQYPKIHTEPASTVSTGVVLNLRNPKIANQNVPQDQPVPTVPQVRGKQSNKRAKPVINLSDPDSDFVQIPLPFGQLPTADLTNRQVSSMGSLPSDDMVDEGVVVRDSLVNSDEVDYPGTTKRKNKNKFGISSKLAGTIADIGLALSDKLRVSEPSLYDRRKNPLFTRFVDFDDKEVQRMYDKSIDQIQNSQLPEQVKQAQINEVLSKYQDYQGKVDYNNLQRYERKREEDTNKLQSYTDANIDIKVADLDNYRQRKARVNELRDAFNAQRKGRIVNSLKAYADYADKINYMNQTIPNFKVNPITGQIDYKANQQSDLSADILNKYSKSSNNKINLGNGLTGTIVGGKMIVTNADGSKFEAINLE